MDAIGFRLQVISTAKLSLDLFLTLPVLILLKTQYFTWLLLQFQLLKLLHWKPNAHKVVCFYQNHFQEEFLQAGFLTK